MNSIRQRLLLSLLLPLTAVALLTTILSWREATATADLIFDRTLLASARVIAERIHASEGQVDALIPPSALSIFAADDVERIVYNISAPDGSLIAGDPDVVHPEIQLNSLEPLFFNAIFRSQPVREVALLQPVVELGHDQMATVIVGSTRKGHDAMVSRLWGRALRNEMLMLVAACVLSIIGLHFGLRPLLKLVRDVAQRDARALTPIEPTGLPKELRPLVEALNGAFARVSAQVEAQRRFIANAAHQLRTPLSVLKLQTSVALREPTLIGKQDVLTAIDHKIDATSRLVSQLLSLARAEQGALLFRSNVDVQRLTHEVLEAQAIVALDKSIDLGLTGAQDSLVIEAHPALLREMISNLVENAIKYTPPGGVVTVHISKHGPFAVLKVEDTGPGIADDQLEKVFERFYRLAPIPADNVEVEGTGLGLAIVREIATAHGGHVSLRRASESGGLIATVRLTLISQ